MGETAKPSVFTGKEFAGVTLPGILAQYKDASLILLEPQPDFLPPEAHAGHIDLFIVDEGEVHFRFGGILEGHQFRTKPDGSLNESEVVGTDMIDGPDNPVVEVTLRKGDKLWLPPMTPHQHCESSDARVQVAKIPLISKEHASPTRVPTQWETKGVVKEGYMKQYDYLGRLAEQVNNVPGDFVECGLGEGNTFGMLAHLVGSHGWAGARKLWGFDSFQGWPEPTEHDTSPRNPKKGEWKVPREMVERVLNESGVRENYPNLDIEIVPGFVSDTLPNFPKDRRIAFLHLDLDLYPGYRDGLENLFDLVSVGGIIALDEYGEFPNLPEYGDGKIEKWPGCTKAVNDFLASRGLPSPIYDPAAGKYYMIKPAV